MPYSKLIFFTALAAIFIIALSLFQFYLAVKPPKFTGFDTPETYSMEFEDVLLKTQDNITLAGWFIPAKIKTDNAIIVGHGYPFDKSNILVITPFLQERYNLLLFDFRYFGESNGSYTTLGYKEQLDLDAAISYLKERNQTIGMLGFSMSASTALMSDNPEINAIVADSPYASLILMTQDVYKAFIFTAPFELLTKLYAKLFFGINIDEASPLKSIAKTGKPVLLIHGSKDSQISVGHSYLLKNLSKTAELWIVENADHGEAHSIAREEYEHKVMAFFGKHLN